MKDAAFDSGGTWKSKILQAIHAERYAPGGRVGDTPLSRLSDELNRLPREERESLVDVFVELVKQPTDEDMAMTDYWSSLSFLTYDIKGAPSLPNLRYAFRSRLFGKNAVSDEALVFTLRGYCAADGRLYRSELNGLEVVKLQHPLDWLNAAVMSTEFELASESAKQMLREGTIDVGRFLLALDSWKEQWSPRVSFSRLVQDFRRCIVSRPEQQKINNWMERRGMTDGQPGQHQSRIVGHRRSSDTADAGRWLGGTNDNYAICA